MPNVNPIVIISSGGVSDNNAAIMQTGAASFLTYDDGYFAAGRNNSFFILKEPIKKLDGTDLFPHSQRFCGLTGGYYDQTLVGYYDKDGVSTTEALAFPDDILLDCSTYELATGNILMWRRTDNATNIRTTDALPEAVGLTVGSFSSGWRVPNRNENEALICSGCNPCMGYGALKLDAGTTYLITSTMPCAVYSIHITVVGAINAQTEARPVATSSSSGRRYLPCRNGNISELP